MTVKVIVGLHSYEDTSTHIVEVLYAAELQFLLALEAQFKEDSVYITVHNVEE